MNLLYAIAVLALPTLAGIGGCGGEPAEPANSVPAPNITSFLDGVPMTEGISKALLRQEIQAFSGVKGRNPDSLQELAGFRNFKVPPAPPGMRWDYQPEVGSVELVAK